MVFFAYPCAEEALRFWGCLPLIGVTEMCIGGVERPSMSATHGSVDC